MVPIDYINQYWLIVYWTRGNTLRNHFRPQCINMEALCKIDEKNGGFLPGRRTADNLFIISGLAQRQLLLGKCLILCFVDFSKAFDMVNRNILFYKIIKSGWYGKVTDTLRSLYTKTSFRVKHQGWLSFLIRNTIGVYQGGVASGFIFREVSLWSGWIFKHTRWHLCWWHACRTYLVGRWLSAHGGQYRWYARPVK